jgi:PAS domain S-box-containing protein
MEESTDAGTDAQTRLKNNFPKKYRKIYAGHNLLLPGVAILFVVLGWFWVISLAIPLPEFLGSIDVQGKIGGLYVSMGLVTLAVLALLIIWNQGQRQRDQAEAELEQLYGQLQKELKERTQAEQRAIELNRHLLAVQHIGAAIASSLDLDYILNTVTVEIVHLLGVEQCAIYEWDQVADIISIIALFDLNAGGVAKELNKFYHLADYPLTQSVLAQKQAQQISLSQPDADPAELTYMKANQLKSMLLLPMEAQDKVMGLLEITDSRAERIFRVDEIALTEQFANQAASAIKNAQLYAEINRRLKEQTALQEAMMIISSTLDLTTVLNHIVEQMGLIVDATSAYICSYETKTMTSTVLAEYFGPRATAQEKISDLGVTYSLPRDYTSNFQSLLDGQSELIHLSDARIDESKKSHLRQFGTQTILNIPLRVRSQTIAFAELWESQQERRFTREEMALFQSIAQQAAIALNNVHLYDRATTVIAERRKVERELRESETKFRILAETTAAAICIFDQNRIRYLNPAAEAIAGYTRAELLTMDFWQIIHPEFRELIKGWTRTDSKGEPIPHEIKILTKNQEVRWLDVTLGMIRFEGEIAILGTAFDITDRKRAEESLRKSEANLKAIFENSQQAFILIDKDYGIRAFNKIADEGTKLILGNALKEGHSIHDYLYLQGLDEFNSDFDQVLQGKRVSLERNFLINGTEIWQEFNYNPVFADDGQVMGVCFSTFDITERKKLTETMAKNENRLLAEIHGMLAITRALVTETNLKSLLEFIMIQATYLTGADGVAVLLLDEDGQQLEAVTLDKNQQQLNLNTQDEPTLRIQSKIQLPLKGSLAELAITTHTTQISSQAKDDERLTVMRAMLNLKQIHTLICVPLTIQNKDLGVLLIWSERERHFIEQDNRIIALFANQAALALNNAYLHALNRQLAIEQERQRLARDLHDSVTQTLYSIGMAAETALKLIDRETKKDIQRPVLHIHQLSQIALKEIREQVHNLHLMAFADKTLTELLEAHCNLMRKQYALAVELTSDADLKLSMYQRVNLYYLVKEALWNVVKHAPGAHVYISITLAANLATLSIVDNGPGFVEDSSVDMEMYGLRSMRERAILLGGSFELVSQPNEGTRITVQIPIT